jgi:hypothetical protein
VNVVVIASGIYSNLCHRWALTDQPTGVHPQTRGRSNVPPICRFETHVFAIRCEQPDVFPPIPDGGFWARTPATWRIDMVRNI